MADKSPVGAPLSPLKRQYTNLLINKLQAQNVADRQLEIDNMPLREIMRSMKRDPDGYGMSALGFDGVLRTFDAERNILDAVGLSPTQIREYYEGLPMPERFLTADGRNVSLKDMFHPDPENVPKKVTEEDKARILAYNEELKKRGVSCCAPGKSTDDSKPDAV
ncbi:hypothetical protein FGADI_10316 [Fusarium gaditjirri]|uniref:Uncharacterized protein n=1 Tax=Fusarium gaditjirri TaxID=282569 RepID=A0A8H4WRU3_9HYPO|nr:hypothetical protein FGADI_10316 [Fusarium gaditjirri]